MQWNWQLIWQIPNNPVLRCSVQALFGFSIIHEDKLPNIQNTEPSAVLQSWKRQQSEKIGFLVGNQFLQSIAARILWEGSVFLRNGPLRLRLVFQRLNYSEVRWLRVRKSEWDLALCSEDRVRRKGGKNRGYWGAGSELGELGRWCWRVWSTGKALSGFWFHP